MQVLTDRRSVKSKDLHPQGGSMIFEEAKVYFDGSHYIAIPHTERDKALKRKERKNEVIVDKETGEVLIIEERTLSFEGVHLEWEEIEVEEDIFPEEPLTSEALPEPEIVNEGKDEVNKHKSLKDHFEEYYREAQEMPKKERKRHIKEKMKEHIRNEDYLNAFVEKNLERKLRNLICRRIRLTRKANLQEFNYFCTFTYDNKLHNEDSFKKRLKTAFRNLCNRKGWKYIGVWERSPEKKRLHFHGIFYIPEGTMPEVCIERNDYSFATHKRETINQNTYFLTRFGRNDFEPIDDRTRMGEAMAYLMKYIEKTGEKIVYSKGLPQYFISDIYEDDVITRVGLEEQKLLLFDNFTCYDEGVYVGVVSSEVISQLRKANS